MFCHKHKLAGFKTDHSSKASCLKLLNLSWQKINGHGSASLESLLQSRMKLHEPPLINYCSEKVSGIFVITSVLESPALSPD